MAFLGGLISGISGAAKSFFSGEGRERRQARRAARKATRAKAKATVTAIEIAADAKEARGGAAKLSFEAFIAWLKLRWMWVVGGIVLLFLFFAITGKKKPRTRRRRRNPTAKQKQLANLAKARRAKARKARAGK